MDEEERQRMMAMFGGYGPPSGFSQPQDRFAQYSPDWLSRGYYGGQDTRDGWNFFRPSQRSYYSGGGFQGRPMPEMMQMPPMQAQPPQTTFQEPQDRFAQYSPQYFTQGYGRSVPYSGAAYGGSGYVSPSEIRRREYRRD